MHRSMCGTLAGRANFIWRRHRPPQVTAALSTLLPLLAAPQALPDNEGVAGDYHIVATTIKRPAA